MVGDLVVDAVQRRGVSRPSSGAVRAVMQGDGNFVLYKSGGIAAWSTRTNGYSGAHIVMQGDGNFVVYRRIGPTPLELRHSRAALGVC